MSSILFCHLSIVTSITRITTSTSPYICSIGTRYDHLFVFGDRTIQGSVYVHSLQISYQFCSVCVSVRSYLYLLQYASNTWLFYKILLVNIVSYYDCLLYISPVLLLTVSYFPRTSLHILSVQTQCLIPLTFMSMTRKGPACGTHVYPGCCHEYAQSSACELVL